jgi:heme A synthase
MDTHAGGDQQLVGYYSPFKVIVHFAHRVWAIVVVATALALVSILASRGLLAIPVISRLAISIMVLLLVQISLGALIIWTGRNAEIATAHQTTGAVILGVTTVLAMQLEMFPSRMNVLLLRELPGQEHGQGQGQGSAEAGSESLKVSMESES